MKYHAGPSCLPKVTNPLELVRQVLIINNYIKDQIKIFRASKIANPRGW